jgi:hypothetical protein
MSTNKAGWIIHMVMLGVMPGWCNVTTARRGDQEGLLNWVETIATITNINIDSFIIGITTKEIMGEEGRMMLTHFPHHPNGGKVWVLQ